MSNDVTQITDLCRLHTRLALMDGHKIDKPAARYNAMTDYVLHCYACAGDLSGMMVLHHLVFEAVHTAVVGDVMNTPGEPFDRSAYTWMEKQP